MPLGLSSSAVITPFLNALRGSAAWSTIPSGLYVKLHIGDPGVGAGAPAAGSVTRVVVALTAPAGNAIAISGTAPLWTNGGTTETLTHISIWDALTAGNFLWSAILTASQSWSTGNTFTLTSLGVALAPVAA